ncbi:MAG TPA: hypothetical protein VIT85_05515 [Solirubrobacterales bacterium]
MDEKETEQQEIDRAKEEARKVGGEVEPLSDDPALEPVEEAGGGESEGFEQAERRLEEVAEHGDEHRFPDRDVPDPEEPEGAERGEADAATPPDA